MSIFSSRPPFNDDRFPYVVGNTRLAYDGTLGGVHTVYAPDPDFDRPQTNPTNPVLLAYRDGDVNADQVIHMGSALVGAWVGPMVITATHAKHARRVLSRLVALQDVS